MVMPHGPELSRALHEGLAADPGGEVLVRSGDFTGRIFLARGRVAWAVASTQARTFGGRLVEARLIPEADLAALFAECKRSGQNFAEAILDWGLLDADRLRAELLGHVRAALLEIFAWPAGTAMFFPSTRAYHGRFTFTLSEFQDRTSPAETKPAPRQLGPELLTRLRGLEAFRLAGVAGPGGELLWLDAEEGGPDPGSVAAAIGGLRSLLDGPIGQARQAVIGGDGGTFVLRSCEVSGLGRLDLFLLLGRVADQPRSQLHVDRALSELAVEVARLGA